MKFLSSTWIKDLKDFRGVLFLLLKIDIEGNTFIFYVEVYDFLNIVKCICLISLLTIHYKALHNKGYPALESKKGVGNWVYFEFSFTNKLCKLVMTNNSI